MKKILVLNANPNKDSFNAKISKAYEKGAKKAGHQVKRFDLVDLDFNYNSLPHIELEPDLVKQQELISWADHIVITTPVWWYQTTALLKAYFDRILTPHFAYKYRKSNWLVDKSHITIPIRLLKGKTARFITTQDSSILVLYALGNPFNWSVRFGLFWFVGLKMRRTVISGIRTQDEQAREKILAKFTKLGEKGK